jgi:hypothetical protein
MSFLKLKLITKQSLNDFGLNFLFKDQFNFKNKYECVLINTEKRRNNGFF